MYIKLKWLKWLSWLRQLIGLIGLIDTIEVIKLLSINSINLQGLLMLLCTDDLLIWFVCLYGMDDWEGKLSLCQILAVSFVARILGKTKSDMQLIWLWGVKYGPRMIASSYSHPLFGKRRRWGSPMVHSLCRPEKNESESEEELTPVSWKGRNDPHFRTAWKHHKLHADPQ